MTDSAAHAGAANCPLDPLIIVDRRGCAVVLSWHWMRRPR